MKNVLIFLWIFIFPIFVWISKLFFSKNRKKVKLNDSQKRVLEVFFLFDIFFYTIVLPILFDPSFNRFQEAVYDLCMLQIIAFDALFLYTFFWSKKVLKIFDKGPFFIAFLGVIFFLLIRVIIFVGIIYFHFVSIFEFFMTQKVPIWLIIFILLFNPIYMFYQMKERLSKNG